MDIGSKWKYGNKKKYMYIRKSKYYLSRDRTKNI